jgi:hypothetical protein
LGKIVLTDFNSSRVMMMIGGDVTEIARNIYRNFIDEVEGFYLDYPTEKLPSFQDFIKSNFGVDRVVVKGNITQEEVERFAMKIASVVKDGDATKIVDLATQQSISVVSEVNLSKPEEITVAGDKNMKLEKDLNLVSETQETGRLTRFFQKISESAPWKLASKAVRIGGNVLFFFWAADELGTDFGVVQNQILLSLGDHDYAPSSCSFLNSSTCLANDWLQWFDFQKRNHINLLITDAAIMRKFQPFINEQLTVLTNRFEIDENKMRPILINQIRKEYQKELERSDVGRQQISFDYKGLMKIDSGIYGYSVKARGLEGDLNVVEKGDEIRFEYIPQIDPTAPRQLLLIRRFDGERWKTVYSHFVSVSLEPMQAFSSDENKKNMPQVAVIDPDNSPIQDQGYDSQSVPIIVLPNALKTK